MMLLYVLALGIALLWAAIVVLGLLGHRRGAAIVGGLTGIAASAPFVPRLLVYLFDRDGFITSYGTAAVGEVRVGAVSLACGLVALLTAPLAAKRAWAWLLPALSSLPPVALLVWLAFWFRIYF